MKLTRFRTKYGYKVIGGRYDFARSPSSSEELEAPIEIVPDALIAKAEADHEAAINEYRKSYNLDPLDNG